MKASDLGMIANEKPFHIRYKERRIQELEEYRKQGNPYIEVTVDSLQSLTIENLSLHYRLDQLEKMLGYGYNCYIHPLMGISKDTTLVGVGEAQNVQ